MLTSSGSPAQTQLLTAGLIGAAGAVVTMVALNALWPFGASVARKSVTFSTTATEFIVTPRLGASGSSAGVGLPPIRLPREGSPASPGGAAADGAAAGAPAPSSLAPQPQPQPQPPAAAGGHANVNGVPLEGGKTMHLGVGEGDVAQRVLSVGDVGRAERLSAALLGASRHTVTSSRGFVTHTGTFNGLPLTICATLMGFANMDFVVRELRACVPGPMAVLRLGTCGGLQEHVPEGTLVVVNASLCVRRNPDAAAAPAPYAQATALPLHAPHGAAEGGSGGGGGGAHAPSLAATPAFPYDISGRVAPHAGLSALYAERLGRTQTVVQGLGASADSFYSSQGRASGAWGDRNAAVLPTLERAGVCALEMETCAWQGRACARVRTRQHTPAHTSTHCYTPAHTSTHQHTLPTHADASHAAGAPSPPPIPSHARAQSISWTWRAPLPAATLATGSTLPRRPLCSSTGPRARR